MGITTYRLGRGVNGWGVFEFAVAAACCCEDEEKKERPQHAD
jgi:hypothetical protein